MNDHQILADIQCLKQEIEESFGDLIKESKKLQNESKQSIKNFQLDLEKFNSTLANIGGSEKLAILLEQIHKIASLLQQHQDIGEQINQQINQYENIGHEIEDKLALCTEQLKRCSSAEMSMIEAYKHIEDLHLFCKELLEIRQFLQGVKGFQSLFLRIQRVTQSIQKFQENQSEFESAWHNNFESGKALLSELTHYQENLSVLLTDYQNNKIRLESLEESMMLQSELIESQTQKILQLDIDYQNFQERLSSSENFINLQNTVNKEHNKNLITIRELENNILMLSNKYDDFSLKYNELLKRINSFESKFYSQIKTLQNIQNEQEKRLNKQNSDIENHQDTFSQLANKSNANYSRLEAEYHNTINKANQDLQVVIQEINTFKNQYKRDIDSFNSKINIINITQKSKVDKSFILFIGLISILISSLVSLTG